MMKLHRRITYMALLGGAMGLIYGMCNLTLLNATISAKAIGLPAFVALIGLSPTISMEPLPSFIGLVPMWLLVVLIGGIMPAELRSAGAYRFTRESGRGRWYLYSALKLMLLAAIYWMVYALLYGAVFAVADGFSAPLNGIDAVPVAVCVHLLPFSLALLLWTNWLASRLPQSVVCACAMGLMAVLVLLLPLSGLEFSWIAALNPMVPISIGLREWFATSGLPFGLSEYAAVYWSAVLITTGVFQMRYYKRVDIL